MRFLYVLKWDPCKSIVGSTCICAILTKYSITYGHLSRNQFWSDYCILDEANDRSSPFLWNYGHKISLKIVLTTGKREIILGLVCDVYSKNWHEISTHQKPTLSICFKFNWIAFVRTRPTRLFHFPKCSHQGKTHRPDYILLIIICKTINCLKRIMIG